MPMTEKRWKEIQAEYRKSVRTLRLNDPFEWMTFHYHPDSDDARRALASFVPELLREVRRLRKKCVS